MADELLGKAVIPIEVQLSHLDAQLQRAEQSVEHAAQKMEGSLRINSQQAAAEIARLQKAMAGDALGAQVESIKGRFDPLITEAKAAYDTQLADRLSTLQTMKIEEAQFAYEVGQIRAHEAATATANEKGFRDALDKLRREDVRETQAAEAQKRQAITETGNSMQRTAVRVGVLAAVGRVLSVGFTALADVSGKVRRGEIGVGEAVVEATGRFVKGIPFVREFVKIGEALREVALGEKSALEAQARATERLTKANEAAIAAMKARKAIADHADEPNRDTASRLAERFDGDFGRQRHDAAEERDARLKKLDDDRIQASKDIIAETGGGPVARQRLDALDREVERSAEAATRAFNLRMNTIADEERKHIAETEAARKATIDKATQAELEAAGKVFESRRLAIEAEYDERRRQELALGDASDSRVLESIERERAARKAMLDQEERADTERESRRVADDEQRRAETLTRRIDDRLAAAFDGLGEDQFDKFFADDSERDARIASARQIVLGRESVSSALQPVEQQQLRGIEEIEENTKRTADKIEDLARNLRFTPG